MKSVGGKAVAAFAFVALLGLAACDDPFQVIEETEFAASLGVDLSAMQQIEGGTYIQDIELGTGPAVVLGSDVFVTYTGWLADGTQFDAGSFGFQVTEQGGAIEGFKQGLIGMQAGGTRLLVIPPGQAYGDREVGMIPPGSILVFRVTLDEVSGA